MNSTIIWIELIESIPTVLVKSDNRCRDLEINIRTEMPCMPEQALNINFCLKIVLHTSVALYYVIAAV